MHSDVCAFPGSSLDRYLVSVKPSYQRRPIAILSHQHKNAAAAFVRFEGTYLKLFHVWFCVLLLLSTTIGAHGATSGIIGDWAEPTGSVIRIAPCGARLCARIVYLSAQAPTALDSNNPDVSQRSRPLCGMVIGQGFQLLDLEHAEGGYLYDPKSGRTYHGSMRLQGDSLYLRGYIGVKLFGRTEIWKKVTPVAHPCSGRLK